MIYTRFNSRGVGMKFRGLAGLFNGRGGIYAGGQSLTSVSFLAELITNIFASYALGSATPTFTRATTATFDDFESVLRSVQVGEVRFTGARRVQNLVTTSSQAFSTGWTKTNGGTGSACTITDNFATAPDGTLTASRLQFDRGAGTTSTDISSIKQTLSSTCKQTWYLKTNDGSKKTLCASGNSVVVTGTWQRLNTVSDNVIQMALRGDIGSSATADILAWGAMAENTTGQSNTNPSEYVSVGVLSAPYHGANVDGVKYFSTTNGNTVSSNVVTEATGTPISTSVLKKYRAEGQRTNIGRQSNAYTTTWTSNYGTATQNVTGPDGLTSAWSLTDNSAAAVQSTFLSETVANDSATYCHSEFVKKTSGATIYAGLSMELTGGTPKTAIAVVNTNTGAISSTSADVVASGVINFNTDFWRVWYTTANNTTGNTALRRIVWSAYNSDGTQTASNAATGTNVWFGSQLEAGTYPSSYIPTTTASVTRNADDLQYVVSGNISQAIGWFYAEVITDFGNVSFANGVAGMGSAGRLAYFSASSSPDSFRTFDGTVDLVSPTVATFNNSTGKLASTWGGSTMLNTARGATPLSGAFDGTMGAGAVLYIGSYGTAGNELFGNVGNVRIGTNKLSSAQLQAMTT